METLREHVDTLKQAESGSWNLRGTYVVGVPKSDGVSAREFGLQIYSELWKEHSIIDNTILIATADNYVPINGTKYTDILRKYTLDLYTGFPYEHGSCVDVNDVTLLDQWRPRNETFYPQRQIIPS